MGKQQTSNRVIVETILTTGMKHTDAAELGPDPCLVDT